MKPTITVTDRAVLIETDQYLLTLQMRAGSFNVNDRTRAGITPQDAKPPVSTPHKKKAAITDQKTCAKCGRKFIPNSNRQVYCSEACGMKAKWQPKKKKLTQEEEAELEHALKEIEGKRNKPYEFIDQL